MNRVMKVSSGFVFGLLLVSTSQSAFSSQYTAQDLGTLGGTRSFAQGVNRAGIVVGTSYDAGNALHAFIYDGQMHMLPDGALQAFDVNDSGVVVGNTAQSSYTYENGVLTSIVGIGSARGINNNNQVVGYAYSGGGYAYLYENNTVTDLGMLPGSYSSMATAINDAGVIAGISSPTSFIYEAGAMTDLGDLGGGYSFAYDINNSNQVVGYSRTVDGSYNGFIYENGAMRDIGDYDGHDSLFFAINDSGYAVGYATVGVARTKTAIIYSPDGSILSLNDIEVTGAAFEHFSFAIDINDSGQIVGSGIINGEEHAFLLTPLAKPCNVHANYHCTLNRNKRMWNNKNK